MKSKGYYVPWDCWRYNEYCDGEVKITAAVGREKYTCIIYAALDGFSEKHVRYIMPFVSLHGGSFMDTSSSGQNNEVTIRTGIITLLPLSATAT